MYTIICYKNTGFNPINIPDTPSLVDSMDVILTQQIDVLQDRWLQSASVKSTYDEISDCDYCKIGDTYYSVTNVTMSSVDVAELSLVMDCLTTAGGPLAIQFLDGITDRHTTASDDMFQFTESDPLTAPALPLEVEVTRPTWDIPGDTANKTIVESTINLSKLGDQFTTATDGTVTFTGQSITFSNTDEDEESGKLKVTVPYTEGVSTDATTVYRIGDKTVKSPNTRQWDTDNEKVNLALGAVRSLSVESAIISQVVYPDGYITVNESSGGAVSVVDGKTSELTSGIPYKSDYGTTIHNNRVYYGEYNKYGLITASGDKGEFLPEQIYKGSDGADDGTGSPTIKVMADPRPTGKPYFRFKNYLGDSSDDGFLLSSVSGLQWSNAPLTYVAPSGSYQTRIDFENRKTIMDTDATNRQQQINAQLERSTINNMANAFKTGMQALSASISPNAPSVSQNALPGSAPAMNLTGPMALLSGAISAGQSGYNIGMDFSDASRNLAYNKSAYINTLYRELTNYAISMHVSAPDILFPFSANLVRDFYGNNVVCYKYKYNTNDAVRIDHLLTMYGYKDTRALSPLMFEYRQYFDYVSATGVSIGGNIPLDFKQGIADQLNVGVRVWHVKPSSSYYSSGNPIRS